MKKTLSFLAALTMGVVSATAGTPAPVVTGKNPPPPPVSDPCAGPISYNNVELLYVYTDIDGYGDSGNGGLLSVEYSPMQNLYLTASAEYIDMDYGNLWILKGGIGGYLPLTDNIHLAADGGVAWARAEADYWVADTSSANLGHYRTESDDEFGWYVRPHLRAKFGCLTIHAGAEYLDIGDDNSATNGDWAGFASLYYQVAPNWDITGGVRLSEDTTQWSGGVRFRY